MPQRLPVTLQRATINNAIYNFMTRRVMKKMSLLCLEENLIDVQ